MKILIVGFGGMGCRHAQSVLTAGIVKSVHSVEPSEEIFQANLQRIGATTDQVQNYKSLDDLVDTYDIAIVATSSMPRFEIVKTLIKKGVKLFLLEKVLFQSESQFRNIIELIEANNCKTYCNLPNRYFTVYSQIKKIYESKVVSNFTMNLIAGDFGLTCNSIHYIDIFKFISGQEVRVQSKELQLSPKPNRRGDIYRELVGEYALTGTKNGKLNIIANPEFEGGAIIHIAINDETFVLYENTQKAYHFSEKRIDQLDFKIIPSSKLTSIIVSEMIAGTCTLPSIQDLLNIHIEFFKTFNPSFNLIQHSDTICPIT